MDSSAIEGRIKYIRTTKVSCPESNTKQGTDMTVGHIMG